MFVKCKDTGNVNLMSSRVIMDPHFFDGIVSEAKHLNMLEVFIVPTIHQLKFTTNKM